MTRVTHKIGRIEVTAEGKTIEEAFEELSHDSEYPSGQSLRLSTTKKDTPRSLTYSTAGRAGHHAMRLVKKVHTKTCH